MEVVTAMLRKVANNHPEEFIVNHLIVKIVYFHLIILCSDCNVLYKGWPMKIKRFLIHENCVYSITYVLYTEMNGEVSIQITTLERHKNVCTLYVQ
jgi:hypothetical protein